MTVSHTASRNASRAVPGALYMVGAGVAFTTANVITRHVTNGLGLSSTAEAFYQYGIALLFAVPMLWQAGLASLRTRRPMAHLLRVAVSVLGVQAFVYAFAHGVPLGQVIALVMTSPFFITIGAAVLLHEKVAPQRWWATTVAFAGALLILRPWSSALTLQAWAPVAAAILWGAATLLTKRLLDDEPPSTVTVWLLLLMTPVNLGFSLADGFRWPTAAMLGFLLASGAAMALAQLLLAKSYAVADAAYVQPFDGLKLPLNFLAGWLVFGDAPHPALWAGASLILAASYYNLRYEALREKRLAAA